MKGNPKTKLQGSGVSSPKSLQSQMPPHPKKQTPAQSLRGLFTDDEVLFRHVGASAVQGVDFLMVDSLHLEALVQSIPR